MAIGFREPGEARAGHQDISGALTSVLVRWIRAARGESGVLQALAIAGERRTAAELEDVGAWSTHDQTVALLHAGAQVTGDGSIGLHVGEQMLRQHDGTVTADSLRHLGSARALLEQTVTAIARFNAVSSVELVESGDRHAVVRCLTPPGLARHPHLCDFTRGLLSQVPVQFGSLPAVVTEQECQARGGRFCLYSMEWEPSRWSVPTGDTRPATVSPVVAGSPADPAAGTVPDLPGGERDRWERDRWERDRWDRDRWGPPTGAPRIADEGGSDRIPAPEDPVAPPRDATSSGSDVLHGDAGDGRERNGRPAVGRGRETGRRSIVERLSRASPPGRKTDRATRSGERSVTPGSGRTAKPGPSPGAEARETGARGRPADVPASDLMASSDPRDPFPASPQRGTPAELRFDDSTRIAQLTSQLSQMSERLEGVFSTASELLGEEDIDTLLARITSRAARAVSAPQYLLVVRTAPDAPVQLHDHGFNDVEAQVLANELWREHPDDAGGSRLIVDIASSRRRYGRLAAVFPPGVRYFESERRMLALYAGYAATALDVVTALEDARNSDSTRRALLDFAGALSRVSTTDDVARLLADTTKAVIGSDHATVMLWDTDQSELAVRACTAGTTGAGADLRLMAQRPAGADSSDVHIEAEPAPDTVLVPTDSPLIEHMIASREILAVDQSIGDPLIVDLLRRTDAFAAVIAPLFAAEEFLGVVAANFATEIPAAVLRSRDLQERLSGLADQAVTSFQNARLMEQISHMAWHDALTGLPNRRLLEDRVEQELSRAQRMGEGACMFFVDLDRFKTVNDTMGHTTGDELIKQVAQRLCETVRRQDTVARLGGDEFAVLLPGLSDPEAVEQLALRSLEVLHAPYEVFGQEVHTSASIGVAVAPEHGQSYDALLNHADEAMYRSKALGRDTFQMYLESSDEVGSDDDLEADLRRALGRGEFFVLYQPYVDLRTTQVVGVEALVRWRHPVRGVLEPDTFIPLAEASEVIVALDRWVLEESCRQIRRWADAGMALLRLSVNLASRDLTDPELFDNARHALSESNLDPSLLELEITGRVVLDDSEVAPQNIEKLRKLGVRFSIDDFGTGHSSMSRIGSFPVSTLKIEKSFVQVLGPEDDSSNLVAAIISMARRLGLDCVAEGVETSQQGRVLLRRGCTTAQGFFFCPPLLPGDVERMLDEGSRLASGSGGGEPIAARCTFPVADAAS